MLDPEGDSRLFPSEMIPLLAATDGRRFPQPVIDSIHTHHLYRYLNFTILLESLVVNKTILGIYFQTTGISVGTDRRIDALRMYTDEAYHTLAAADLAAQVEVATGIPNLTSGHLDSEFMRRLGKIREISAEDVKPLVELLFVIISETLISGNLSDVAEDPNTNTGVREVIEDHARDEGRHHLYFRNYLEDLWAALTVAERRHLGILVPDLIHSFFAPEVQSVRTELLSYGMQSSAVDDLLAETYSAENIDSSVKNSALKTVEYFTDLGVLEDGAVREKFQSRGLVEGTI